MLNTVSADYFATINPSVLAAGGTGLTLSGLFLTNGNRAPIGTIQSFSSLLSVGNYFGVASAEYAAAAVYYNGFDNSSIKPTTLLFAQYNQVAVPAWIRGGTLSSMTLSQLQALSGTLSVTVNGVVKTSSSINLSSATSFSNAATLMLAGFANIYDAVTAATTTVAAGTATNSTAASITGNVMTVGATVTGTFVVGGLLTGTGVTAGTYIISQLTGTTGGIGTYLVSAVQTVASTTITQTYGLMTVATVSSGTLAVGQVVSGGTIVAGTTITAQASGTVGGAGTYVLSGGSQTVSATTVSAGPMTIVYDSIASAFLITGGTPGAVSTIAYVSGTLAAGINLTAVTGAVLSQGAAAATPSAFMNALILQTTNWASFCTLFNPDSYVTPSNSYGNANKLLFMQWNNTQNNGFLYACWDNDATPTTTVPATSSLGYLASATQLNLSGTALIYDPTNEGLAPFLCGLIASINFNATNGNINPTYRTQSGLAATVTNQTVMTNLQANGYNCMVAVATNAQGFTYFWNGQVTGSWLWLQPFINQIWLNASFQLNLMQLLTSALSIPYNSTGNGMITAALMTPINNAINFGAIQPGIPLSMLQIAQINTAAGTPIDSVLSTRGWYLQIGAATAAQRQARGTPPINFWYNDGGSIQQITLASIDLL